MKIHLNKNKLLIAKPLVILTLKSLVLGCFSAVLAILSHQTAKGFPIRTAFSIKDCKNDHHLKIANICLKQSLFNQDSAASWTLVEGFGSIGVPPPNTSLPRNPFSGLLFESSWGENMMDWYCPKEQIVKVTEAVIECKTTHAFKEHMEPNVGYNIVSKISYYSSLFTLAAAAYLPCHESLCQGTKKPIAIFKFAMGFCASKSKL